MDMLCDIFTNIEDKNTRRLIIAPQIIAKGSEKSFK
jgi:hypothetical protein